MRAIIVLAIVPGLLAACANPSTGALSGALSSAQFSAGQCRHLTALAKGEGPTRTRLRTEVAALSAVGYDFVSDMDTYPESYLQARHLVSQRYATDCRM